MNNIKFAFILLLFTYRAFAGDSINLQQNYNAQANRNPIPLCPGKVGMAMDFSRATHPARLTKAVRPAKDGWTFESWFRLADKYGKSTIVSSNAWRSFIISIDNGNLVSVRFRKADNKWFLLSGYNDFVPGLWYHLAVTMSPDAGMKIYINSKLTAIKPAKEKILFHKNVFISSLGAYTINPSGSYNNIFKGAINNPCLHDKEMTDKEVAESYNAGDQKLGTIPEVQQVSFLNDQDCNIPSVVNIALQTKLVNAKDSGFAFLAQALKSIGSKLTFSNNNKPMNLVVSGSNSSALPNYVKQKIPAEWPAESYILSVRKNRIDLVLLGASP
ncbi:MAG: LamG domain-containing protein [Victivallales bacterium]|nr:LamG domain-containing protein [Victivallales bacterium]